MSDIEVGDIISINAGPGITEPGPDGAMYPDLQAKFFRVESVQRNEDGDVYAYKLSLPYADKDCKTRYRGGVK